MKARPKTQPEINRFRRESLIAATIKVVARHGIENTTIAKICEAAGVSRGLSGHYFKDKEDLLCQAYQHLQDRHGERTAEAARACRDAVERLKAIVRANFTPDPNNRDNRTAYLAFWLLSMNNNRVAKITEASYEGFYASIEALFVKAFAERHLDMDSHECAMALIGMIDGLWLEISIGVPAVTAKSAVKTVHAYLESIVGSRSTDAHDDSEERRSALPKGAVA